MARSRATLERIGSRVCVPQPAFDGLMRRRTRMQRNRRLESIALAVVVAAIATWGLARAFGQFRSVPAVPPQRGRSSLREQSEARSRTSTPLARTVWFAG
jgi:hypothetical protein